MSFSVNCCSCSEEIEVEQFDCWDAIGEEITCSHCKAKLEINYDEFLIYEGEEIVDEIPIWSTELVK